MAHKAHKPTAKDSQGFAKYIADGPRSDLAYEAYSEMRKLGCEHPWLLDNPYFQALQDTAYARFLATFEAQQ